ncbi:MAG: hypothetical protein J6X37_05010 [Treponema sp.]|nr:hypothetical protein [Treponema sp.]
MNKNRKFFIFILAPLCALFFTGCPVNIVIQNTAEENVMYFITTSAGKEIKKAFLPPDKLKKQNETLLFDSIEIEKALLKSGFTSASALTHNDMEKGEENLTIKAYTSKKTFDFIKYTHSKDGFIKSVSVTLSPEILQDLITNQNSIIQKYADLLMAPCFTGEELTKEEYIEVLSSLYGEKLAEELTQGYLSIRVPLRNSEKKGLPGVKIPVIELLTLQEEKTYTFSVE